MGAGVGKLKLIMESLEEILEAVRGIRKRVFVDADSR